MGDAQAVALLERKLVEHCSPTLAGLKCASMFTCHLRCPGCPTPAGCGPCRPMGRDSFDAALASVRGRLSTEGIEIRVLAERERGMLLLVYRPRMLAATLADPDVASFLASLGYDVCDLDAALSLLERRVRLSDGLSGRKRTCAFPHEVGLFLGYPLDDVVSFIASGGTGGSAGGCWRVYSAERDAEDCFCRLRECARECVECYERGATIEELAARGRAAGGQAA